ncbi:cytochrome P450 [Aspergillus karnatakaensis]|uniref:cytochrome P450 n=1 Tax=Aspergillus karnatakaensis TaxID=1810916 RepID=UPI003CCD71A8
MGALFDAAANEGVSWTLVGGLPLIYLRDPVLIRQLFIKSSSSISRCGSQTKGPFGTGKRIIRNALITADGEVARQWHADMVRGFHNSSSMEVFHSQLISISSTHVRKLYTQDWHGPFNQYVHMSASMSYPLQHILISLLAGQKFSQPDYREKNLHDRIDACVLRLLQDNLHLINPERAAVDKMNFLQRISHESGGTAADPITHNVLAHAKQIFSHGFPAPTLLLLWALRELTLQPKVKEKLRAELIASSWYGDSNLQTLSQLPYLDAVVNEVLRLYPPIPTTARAIDESIDMETESGFHFVIPITARVAVSLDMLHHDPQIWGEDAAHLRPERWEGLLVNTVESECKYLPFLTGPRRCPCTGFVIQQVKVFLAVLLRETDLEVTNAAAVEKRLGPVAEPTVPVSFVAHPL